MKRKKNTAPKTPNNCPRLNYEFEFCMCLGAVCFAHDSAACCRCCCADSNYQIILNVKCPYMKSSIYVCIFAPMCVLCCARFAVATNTDQHVVPRSLSFIFTFRPKPPYLVRTHTQQNILCAHIFAMPRARGRSFETNKRIIHICTKHMYIQYDMLYVLWRRGVDCMRMFVCRYDAV